MKKADIVTRLTSMRELTKATEIHAEIDKLIADLGPITQAEEGKVAYFVTVNERKLDPNVKYPKQMIRCHEILEEGGLIGKTVDRSAIMELIGADKALTVKQTPDRIYAFYQKRMEDEGWIKREKVRA